MRAPAKVSFSARCSEGGICGALGSLDQDVSDESDMCRTRVAGNGGCMWGVGEAEGRGGGKKPQNLMGGSAGGQRVINIR